MASSVEAVAKFTEQLREYGPNDPEYSIERFAPVLDSALGLRALKNVCQFEDEHFFIPELLGAGFSILHLLTLRDAAKRWTEQEATAQWFLMLLRALHKHATYTGVEGNPRMAMLLRLGLHEDTFNDEEALSCIKNKYVDYLCGVEIKMMLDDAENLDGSGYDRAHGEGLFRQIKRTLPYPPRPFKAYGDGEVRMRIELSVRPQ